MTPIVIEPAAEEPVTVDEARTHIEAQPYMDSDTDTSDDMMIGGMVSAARDLCEQFLGVSLALRTLEIAPDEFPGRRNYATPRERELGIELPFGPVREILSVSWGDESGEELGPADYVLDAYRNPNTLRPVSAWPSVSSAPNRVKIRYRAGYGQDSDTGTNMACPAGVRMAILLTTSWLFENRSDTAEIPANALVFLRPHRVRLGMA